MPLPGEPFLIDPTKAFFVVTALTLICSSLSFGFGFLVGRGWRYNDRENLGSD